jgi:AraC-like DNA-binding protein
MAFSGAMRTRPLFEPHLALKEIKLPASGEWMPHFRGWCFLQIQSGVCYWQQANWPLDLSAGSSLVFTAAAKGGLRASQLSEAAIAYFCMEPEKLTGVLSLAEQRCLKAAGAQHDGAVRALPATHPASKQFKHLCQTRHGANVSLRLQLLHLFVDLFAHEMDDKLVVSLGDINSRDRLRQLLNEIAESEFADLSLSDLESKMHCSLRHLSRLFRAEVGASFRQKQAEVRLAKACELLANSNVKVVEAAGASGYQSHSSFSLIFKRRFGVSPGKWRQQHRGKDRKKQELPAAVALLRSTVPPYLESSRALVAG